MNLCSQTEPKPFENQSQAHHTKFFQISLREQSSEGSIPSIKIRISTPLRESCFRYNKPPPKSLG
jgi:hypothetical protein